MKNLILFSTIGLALFTTACGKKNVVTTGTNGNVAVSSLGLNSASMTTLSCMEAKPCSQGQSRYRYCFSANPNGQLTPKACDAAVSTTATNTYFGYDVTYNHVVVFSKLASELTMMISACPVSTYSGPIIGNVNGNVVPIASAMYSLTPATVNMRSVMAGVVEVRQTYQTFNPLKIFVSYNDYCQ